MNTTALFAHRKAWNRSEVGSHSSTTIIRYSCFLRVRRVNVREKPSKARAAYVVPRLQSCPTVATRDLSRKVGRWGDSTGAWAPWGRNAPSGLWRDRGRIGEEGRSRGKLPGGVEGRSVLRGSKFPRHRAPSGKQNVTGPAASPWIGSHPEPLRMTNGGLGLGNNGIKMQNESGGTAGEDGHADCDQSEESSRWLRSADPP